MKKLFAFLPGLLLSTVLPGQVIDQQDFESSIGIALRYGGTMAGVTGDIVTQFLDGSDVLPNAKRHDLKFVSADKATSITLSSYTINDAVLRRDIVSPSGTYTERYSTGWAVLPRLFEMGITYNSESSYNYTVQGVRVTATVEGSTKAVGTEWVTVPAGTFEAIKLQANYKVRETVHGAWSVTTSAETIWLVRGIGEVRHKATTEIRDSTGASATVPSDYSLESASQPLPNLSVFASESWYNGLAYLNFPWVYFFDSNRWVFIYGNPWEVGLDDFAPSELGTHSLDGYLYMNVPWVYAFQDSVYHFLYGSVWIHDMRSGTLWKYE